LEVLELRTLQVLVAASLGCASSSSTTTVEASAPPCRIPSSILSPVPATLNEVMAPSATSNAGMAEREHAEDCGPGPVPRHLEAELEETSYTDDDGFGGELPGTVCDVADDDDDDDIDNESVDDDAEVPDQDLQADDCQEAVGFGTPILRHRPTDRGLELEAAACSADVHVSPVMQPSLSSTPHLGQSSREIAHIGSSPSRKARTFNVPPPTCGRVLPSWFDFRDVQSREPSASAMKLEDKAL